MAGRDPASPIDHWPAPVIDWVATEDGLSIRRGRWFVDRSRGRSRGTVVLMNGRSEFLEKYAETAADLMTRGFDVVSWEWRGQGLSDGRSPANTVMGHVDDFGGYLKDAKAALKTLDPAEFRILLGHSMGGHLALRAVAAGLIAPPAVVLSAPMIGLRPAAGLPPALIAAFAWLMIAIGRGETYPPGQNDGGESRQGFDGNTLTSDPVRFAVQAAWTGRTPALDVGGVSWAWFLAAYRSCRFLAQRQTIDAITMPVTIVQAGLEALVENDAQDRIARRLPNGRLVRIDEARHELLMERDELRDRFWSEFDAAVADSARPTASDQK